MLPAAVSLASETLRVPNRIVRRDNALVTITKKAPTNRGFFFLLAERTGLADMLPAADSLASESLRVQIRIVRRDNALIEMEKGPDESGPSSFAGGADGTRTRDPRRDRPVF
jgi:hypothetical protein